jgi:hypothetical protein
VGALVDEGGRVMHAGRGTVTSSRARGN